MRKRSRGALLALALTFSAAPLQAEVTAIDAGGFVTQDSALLAAPPEQVWAALIEPSRWWNPQHSWSGEAANLTLAPQAGGCFCEALPVGGSVEHARVVYAGPGKLLRLSGALGPLQSEALTGTLTIELTQEREGTRVGWTYVVGGHARFPLAQVAPVVDRVQSEQLERLAALLATVERDAPL